MSVKRINLNLDDELLHQVDAFASRLHITRTAAVSVLLSNVFRQDKAIASTSKLIELLQDYKATGALPTDMELQALEDSISPS